MPVALTVGGNNQSTVYSGVLSGGGSLIKTGSGTLTITASQSYAGPTVVAQGTLQLASPPDYRYHEFVPSAWQGNDTWSAIGALAFYQSNGGYLAPLSESSTGTSPGGQGPSQAANDSPSGSNGKTLISAPRTAPLVYDFGHPVPATSYNWATDQLDDTNRCPTEWQILGSNNDSTWTLLSNMTSSPDPYSSTVTGATTMDVGRFLHATSR